MSHSTVTVVIRDAQNAAEAEAALDDLLEPFNENKEVDPYVEWEDADSIKRLTEWFREDPARCDGESGPEKPFDEFVTDGNIEAWNEWTRQAVGAGNGDPSRGVYDAENDRFGYTCTYNPQSRWDWWALGGRWHGFYLLKPKVSVGSEPMPAWRAAFPSVGEGVSAEQDIANHNGTQDAILGMGGVGGDAPGTDLFGRADLARKGDIDFEMMRTQAQMRAEETFDAYEKAVKGIKPVERFQELAKRHYFDAGIDPDGWQDFRTDLTGDEGLKERRTLFNAPLDAARQEYHNHPWVVALREADLLGWFGDPHEEFYVGDSDARQKFVAQHVESVGGTHALLIDGEWYERGRMGWFAIVSGEKDPNLWNREFNRKIDSLPDDVYLALVDVHI